MLNDTSLLSSSYKDPIWKNLFPIKSFSQCISSKLINKANTNRLITCFTMKVEKLIVNIFRFDLDNVKRILKELKNNINGIKCILDERCDGNRNIMHAAVYSCAPISNNNLASANLKPWSSVSAQKANNICTETIAEKDESSSPTTSAKAATSLVI